MSAALILWMEVSLSGSVFIFGIASCLSLVSVGMAAGCPAACGVNQVVIRTGILGSAV